METISNLRLVFYCCALLAHIHAYVDLYIYSSHIKKKYRKKLK